MLHARISIRIVVERHTEVLGGRIECAEGKLCHYLCRERPNTQVFQTKVSSVRTEEEGRGRTGQVGADEVD